MIRSLDGERNLFMRSLAIAIAVAAGCSQAKPEEGREPAPATAPAASATGPASPKQGAAEAESGSGVSEPIPPYQPAADVPAPIKAAIAAGDRSDDDRRQDAGRKPGEVLAFFGIAPDMKVGELFAGSGYTTELLARIVGDAGSVYGQNSKEFLDKALRQPWTARAAKPAMKRVVTVERPFDAPFPPEAKDLDAVVFVLSYHDTVATSVDREKMNKAVYAALKKGGIYGIVDSSAVAGRGTRDAATLHRIDEAIVKKEVAAAGFKLAGESDVLRNPSDARDWNSSPSAAGTRRGTDDRFVLKYVK